MLNAAVFWRWRDREMTDRQVSRQTCVAFAGVCGDVADAGVVGDVSSCPRKTEDHARREEESDSKTRRVHHPV